MRSPTICGPQPPKEIKVPYCVVTDNLLGYSFNSHPSGLVKDSRLLTWILSVLLLIMAAADMLARVLTDLKCDNFESVRKMQKELLESVYSRAFLLSGDIYPLVGKSLHRNLCPDIYLPSEARCEDKGIIALRSNPSGDCLYSSASLV
ncbi:uncharacterized protein LOC130645624 isoform X1 [Hydractinia symbiolongicarpus]|uniref:uncharacterized protein LOC130645624 isoform X1 n=2 Tax=Hydractinia symbiolongicarpus TaxID=13093 RepID=UPI00254A0616|nr:uncharacterized protein LOC130645624 isoform X1 [Hydractinia symbiolongicarpus]